jgi:hypothetical protein
VTDTNVVVWLFGHENPSCEAVGGDNVTDPVTLSLLSAVNGPSCSAERGEENPPYEKPVDLATAVDVRISELIAEADDR